MKVSKNNKIGVVLINFNSSDFTEACIKSLYKSSWSQYHIYVVDNNSKQIDQQKIRKLEKKYRNKISFIYNKYNLGFAGGNNLGIKAALADGCEYIWLLNNDTEINDLSMELYLKFFKKKWY